MKISVLFQLIYNTNRSNRVKNFYVRVMKTSKEAWALREKRNAAIRAM